MLCPFWDRPVEVWDLLYTSLTGTGTVWLFGSIKSLMRYLPGAETAGFRVVQDIVWEKHNGSGFDADRFKRVHELAVQLCKKGAKWSDVYRKPQYTFDATARKIPRQKGPQHRGKIAVSHYETKEGGPRLVRSVIRARSCHGYAVHPTQKPVDLLRLLVSYSCPEGGFLIDPMCGSGSALVAAESCGVDSLGIEKDPGNFAKGLSWTIGQTGSDHMDAYTRVAGLLLWAKSRVIERHGKI